MCWWYQTEQKEKADNIQSLNKFVFIADTQSMQDLNDSIDMHEQTPSVPSKFSSVKDSLSNTSMAEAVRKNLDDSDNDDIRTVGVGDSLDGEEDRASLSEDLYTTEQSLLDSKTRQSK